MHYTEGVKKMVLMHPHTALLQRGHWAHLRSHTVVKGASQMEENRTVGWWGVTDSKILLCSAPE